MNKEYLKVTRFLNKFETGDILYSKKYDLYYTNIPKTGSESLRSAIKFEDYNYVSGTQYIQKMFAVLRDPVARFESAINMFTLDKFFRNDQHIMLQSEFLYNAPINKIDFFYYNKDVVQEVIEHYKLDIPVLRRNVPTVKTIKVIDDAFIKEIYAEDYELINSVNFVNNGPTQIL